MKSYKLLIGILAITCWLIACTNTPIPTKSTSVATATSLSSIQNETNNQQKTIIAKPQMSAGRAAHTATLLSDGKVLITGGFANDARAFPSAEIFNPKTQSFSSTNPMSVARQSHTATLLPDGKVLLAGGLNEEYLESAELYDPVTGLFTPTGSMTMARSGHVAVLLNNGKVLLMGGTGKGWTFLATAEIYDPNTGIFTATGMMSTPRESHTATLLTDGQVLIIGGHQGRHSAITIYDSAELYDPNSGIFTTTGRMTMPRHKHDATRLADGRVFISGGSDERDRQGAYRSTEIYDLQTGMFTSAAMMQIARYKHTGTSLLLQNGMVLLAGGANISEVYDPQSGTFREVIDSMGTARFFATATLLSSGEILFAGGYGIETTADAQTWILKR